MSDRLDSLRSLRSLRAHQGLIVASASKGKQRDKHMAVYRGLDLSIQRLEFLEDGTTYTLTRPSPAPLPPLATLTDDQIPF